MLEFPILLTLSGLSSSIPSLITSMIHEYGYSAIFVLMLLEGSSLPVPSEVVLPLAGLFSRQGTLSIGVAFLAAFAGSFLGLAVDYYIGYYLGRDVVYKHLQWFHIKKKSLDEFDDWFNKNGKAAVFFSRFVPVVRTIMSFPAGFAEMPVRRFFFYSTIGVVIWDVVLMAFGFYLLSAHSAIVVLSSIGVFATLLYVIYKLSMRYMKR